MTAATRPCPRAGLPGCDGAIPLRDGESLATWKRKRHCSVRCAAFARSGPLEPKACASCGEAFGPRPDEDRWGFRRRANCSAECAAKAGKAKLAGGPRTTEAEPDLVVRCRQCGKPVPRKPGEWPSNYKERKACGDECAKALRRASRPSRAKPDPAPKRRGFSLPGPRAALPPPPDPSVLGRAVHALRFLAPTYPAVEGRDDLWVFGDKLLDEAALVERGMRAAGERW